MFGYLKESNAWEYIYSNMKTLQDLEDHKSLFRVLVDRSKMHIYIIDDEGFDIDPLYSLGYTNISRSTQFQDVTVYKDADVILCDIEGVGNNIDPIQQGLAVAKQLKTIYPSKLIFIYSNKNVQSYGEIPSNLDGIIRKQDSMGDIASRIDEAYSEKKDIISVWKQVRQDMQKDNVSIKTIAFMEHLYCKSLLEDVNLFDNNYASFPFSTEKIENFISILANLINIGLAIKGGNNV